MEYDFVVKPGADPNAIHLAFTGQKSLAIDNAGNLVVEAGAGKSINQKPLVYQTVNGERKLVDGEYVLISKNEVAFKLGAYDRHQAVVIDPVLMVEAFIGGSGDDQGWGVAANNNGVYLTGQTNSINFPLTPQPASGSTPIYQSTKGSGYDAFVTQMSADGTTLIWSTYLGGNGDDVAKGVAVDSNNNVYIAGYTSSANLPMTVGPGFGGGVDAFAAKLSSNGQSLAYLTYFGGPQVDQAFAIALDATNDVYIGGLTTGGLSVVYAPYSTFGGGTTDGFVAKMDPKGNLIASTYLGGSGTDQVNALAADGSGNVYVVGSTSSIGSSGGFPVASTKSLTAGLYAFYAVIKFDFSAVTSANVFGGGSGGGSTCNPASNPGQTGCDSANAVAIGASGTAANGLVYVGGTAGSNFKLGSLTSGGPGAFVAEFKQSSGSPQWISFPSQNFPMNNIMSLAVDSDGQTYFAGQSNTGGAAWGRLTASGGNLQQSQLSAAGVTGTFNAVSVNPQREAFLDGSTSGGSLSGSGSVTTTGAQIGYKTPYSSTLVGNSFNSGANDVLFAAVQYQDLILTTSPTPSAPPSLTFTANYNGSNPGSQSVTISVSNGAACTITPGTLPGGSPFTVTQVSNTSYVISLNGNASTSNPGVTTQQLTFTGSNCGTSGVSADNSPATLTLNYVVNTNLVVTTSSSTSITVTQGTANKTPVVTIPFTIYTGGGSVNYAAAFTSTSGPSGNTFFTSTPPCFTLPSGTASVSPQVVNMTVDTGCLATMYTNNNSSLPAGTYTANISFSGAGVSNTPSFPFTLTVNAAGTAPGSLAVSPTSFNFPFPGGSTGSSQLPATVTATGGTGTYTATITGVPAANLSGGSSNAPSGSLTIVSGASGSLSAGASQTIVVQANPSGVANGLYQAYLTVTSNVTQTGAPTGACNSASTTCNYPITLNIGNGMSVSPGSLTYSAPQGSTSSQLPNGGNQSLTLALFTYNSATFTTQAPTVSGLPAGVLTVTPSNGCSSSGTYTTCPYTATLNAQNLVAGSYSGTITFSPPPSSSNPPPGLTAVTVPVTITVTTQPSLVVSSTSAYPSSALSSAGIVLPLTKNAGGTVSGNGLCSGGAVTANSPTFYLGINGGSDTIASASVSSVSSPAITLVTSPVASALVGQMLSATTYTPVQVCASLPGGSAPIGTFTANITLKDSFGATTTIPVTVAVGSTTAGMIGIFRSNVPGSGGPAQFALDVNGDYKFESGVDKFRIFGLDGDYPVAGDWLGIGSQQIGVFRPSLGAWFLDLNNDGTWNPSVVGTNGLKDGVFFFGLPGDIPVVGDWNGDGRTKFGVFRCPASGVCTFVLDFAGKMAFDPATAVFNSYGLPGDYPVANNWNGLPGGSDQIGVFRCPAVGQPGVCTWIVNSTGLGYYSSSDQQYSYGLPGDIPVVGNWNGTGRKRIGVFRSGTWILNVSGTNVFDFSDQITGFGLPGDQAVVGNWSGPLATNP